MNELSCKKLPSLYVLVYSFCILLSRFGKTHYFIYVKMPQGRRKVPFSGKQKKQQIVAKRQAKSALRQIQLYKNFDIIRTDFIFQNFSPLAMRHTMRIRTVKLKKLSAKKCKKLITKAHQGVDGVGTRIDTLCNSTKSRMNDCNRCEKRL